jgi:hypothetical protein
VKKVIAASLIISATWFLMLPLGSFVLDPGMLVLIGIVIVYVSTRLLKAPSLIGLLAVPTVIIFYLGSLSLYFNLPQADWLHRFAAFFPLIRESPSGFNFMINSGILNFPYLGPEEAPLTLHLFSGFFFATYPLWLYLGIRLGFKMMPQKQDRIYPIAGR